jgi:hypothetical protein
MPRWGKKDDGDTALRTMVEDLKQQQSQLVDCIKNESDGSHLRVSDVLSDLETYMSKLETIVERLANVTDSLVEQSDAALRPWYVRIFCP